MLLKKSILHNNLTKRFLRNGISAFNGRLAKSVVLVCLAGFVPIKTNAQYPDRFVHYRSVPIECTSWQKALASYAKEDLNNAITHADTAIVKYLNERQWVLYLFANNFKAQLQGESSLPKESLTTLQNARDMVVGEIEPLSSIEYIENLLLTARVHTLVNDYKSSENYFNQAADLLSSSGKYPEVLALTYYTLWQLHSKMMSSNKAKEYITKATELLENQKSEYAKAILYFIQAERLDKTQLYLKAELFGAAAMAFEKSGNTKDFTYYTTLMKLSQQYYAFQRDYNKATHYGQKAENYAKANHMSRAKVYGLNFALGDLYRNFNQYDKALEYFTNAKEITFEIFGSKSLEHITANLYLGRLYRYMNQFQNASQCFMEVYRDGAAGWKGKFPHEFTLYGELSRLHLLWDKPDSALHYAQKRLAYEHWGKIFNINDIPPTPRDSYIIRYYRSLATKIEAYKRLYQQTNDTSLLTYGLEHCNYAFELIDIINDKALGEQSGIANSKRAKTMATYGIYFTLELDKHKKDKRLTRQAIRYSELSNANYLKYLLHSRYNEEQGQDSAEHIIRSQIDEIDTQLQNSTAMESPEYDRLYNKSLSLKLQLANIALNTQPSPTTNQQYLNPDIPTLNIDTLQGLIDKDMAIVIYHIDSFNEDSEDITDIQTDYSKRLVTFYIDNKSVEHSTKQLSEGQIEAFEEYLRSLKTGHTQGIMSYGATLYNTLFSDISNQLSSMRKLVIIPDPSFSDIPLESLPTNSDGNPLCYTIATSYHYSTSLWALSKSKTLNTKHTSFAAFAPDFSSQHNELAVANSTTISDKTNANHRVGSKVLAQLPMAKLEVQQLGNLFSSHTNGNAVVYYGTITKSDFVEHTPDFEIIHIASHGFADVRNFRNSGIYFSGTKPNSSVDILHLNEVYGLNMQANLVVLSACHTSIGKKVQGEGVMALPRGFLYAGVPNVIASLWKVHDEKTKELMVAFYTHLLKGNSYAEALKLAKIECINKGFIHTDWAGFVLIGN
jgi:CHAT domain-containing protein